MKTHLHKKIKGDRSMTPFRLRNGNKWPFLLNSSAKHHSNNPRAITAVHTQPSHRSAPCIIPSYYKGRERDLFLALSRVKSHQHQNPPPSTRPITFHRKDTELSLDGREPLVKSTASQVIGIRLNSVVPWPPFQGSSHRVGPFVQSGQFKTIVANERANWRERSFSNLSWRG